MACEQYSEAIGELVDGTLDPAGRRALDEHLASCAACRALAADLRRIHREAAELPRVAPPETLWATLRGRLEVEARKPEAASAEPSPLAPAPARADSAPLTPAPAPARPTPPVRPGWRQAVAGWFRPVTASPLRAAAFSSAVVLLLTVATVLVFFRQPAIAPTTDTAAAPGAGASGAPAMTIPASTGNGADDSLVQSVEMELKLAEQHYENAIASLEQAAKAEQDTLDPEVAEILQKNLAIIDQAIVDSRVALQTQPTNQLAQTSLFDAFRRKVALLQDTITLINEMRKGNQAGAARVLQNLNKS